MITSISIPNAYTEWNSAVGDSSQLVTIEHSYARTRVDQGILLKLAVEAFNGSPFREFVWCGNDALVQKRRLQKWASRYDWKLPINDSTIWFIQPKDADKLPLEAIHRLVISQSSDVNETTANMLLRMTSGRVTLLGTLAPRDHWFYRKCRESQRHHIIPGSVVPYDDVNLRYWREKLTDESYRRLIECEDVDAPERLRTPLADFAASRCTIRDKQSKLITFVLNEPQKEYLEEKRKAISEGRAPRFLVLKSRRRGLSTLEQADAYQRTAELPYHQCVTLAHTDQATRRIFKIAKLIQERDPQCPPGPAVGNQTKIEFNNGSEFFIGTAGSKGFGRGDTLNKVHGSEVAFWCPGPHKMENVDLLVAGLLEACSHGEVVLETTPNGFEWFAQTWKDARAGKNDWICIFLPWFTDPDNRLPTGTFDADEILNTLRKDEKALVRKHKLTTNQLAWRRKKKRELGYLFDQEYPESEETCFLVTGVMYFDKDIVLDALDEEEDESWIRREHVPGGFIYYYEEYDPKFDYVAGSDTSEGLPTSDDNGTSIRRRDNGELVARVYGLFSVNQQAELGAQLVEHYHVSMWGIERENHGHAVILAVKNLGYKGQSDKGILFESKGRIGWTTNSETRPQMLHQFRTYVEENPEKNDRIVLGQCLTFKKQKGGKYEADPGAHDDAVFMDSIAIEMRNHRVKKPRITVG